MINDKNKINSPELLAPAGSLEKLKTALIYGADAVYFGLPGFSLRARASQFEEGEILEGVKFCRKREKKFYIALNIYAHNIHIDDLNQSLKFVKKIKPDGIILSDPGILRIVKKELPDIDIHISTQANVTNKEAVKFWRDQGAKRIILAREVSLKEIREIRKAVPDIELECFVHGAMCMAYSGRCILSKWMLNRSANLGDCAQPCRWEYKGTVSRLQFSSKFLNFGYNLFHKVCKYTIFTNFSQLCFARNLKVWFEKRARRQSLVKNKEDNQLKTMGIVDDQDRFKIELEEDETGTYLFNSNDICLIEHLKELQEAGVDSFKIEGRNKSVYYVAMVVRAYRKALKALQGAKPLQKKIIQEQKKELEKLSNRGYWKSFMFQEEPPHLLKQASKKAQSVFIGISLMNFKTKKSLVRKVFVHNSFKKGNSVEAITPDKIYKTKIINIKNDTEDDLKSAHGGQEKIFSVQFDQEIEGFFILRKELVK
ncbi:MAG: U32 family peptidase [Candidatus Moranbacteria bacterium]|nr:U32 family peptidase [Candidatus Moranbacteria bacterium]